MAKNIDTVPPALAVFGLDTSQKAHGSYFSQDELERAIKAAHDMGLCALRIANDELAALAAKLPRGKLFDSGNAFVPFVSRGLFDTLNAAGEAAGDLLQRPASPLHERPAKPRRAAASAVSGPNKREGVTPQPYTLPATWADISIGSLVLVVDGKDDGYFPAIVQAVGDEANLADRQLQLLFRDFPDYPRQVRKLSEVGLVHAASTSHLPDTRK